MWQLFLLSYFIFGATSYLLRRILAQRFGELNRVINAIFFICFLLPSAIVLSFFFPHNLDVGTLNFFLLFGGSLIWPLANIAAFSANKHVDVSIFTIINNLSPLFTLAVALPFLNEHLQSLHFIGIGFLIVSGVVAASSQFNKHTRASLSGLLMCLLSAGILGIAIAYERFMLSRIDFGAYLIYGWGSQIMWMTILTGHELKKLPQLLNKNAETRKTLIVWGTTRALQSISFILALKISGSASIISAATDFMTVIIIISAYFFLREREHMLHKWIATGIGTIGLLLIAR